MEGSWKGNDRITEVSAVESFGVSRTPVREALLELQGLGLIELRRNCGAVVLPFGTRELGEIYAVRSLLETEATRLAAKAFAADVIGYLIEQFHEIQSTGGIDPDWELDRDLHSRIADCCGNRRLTAEIERYGELIQTIREIVGEQTKGIHLTSAEEHLAILEGLRKRNPGNGCGRDAESPQPRLGICDLCDGGHARLNESRQRKILKVRPQSSHG
jgi:DNA-binding GntR family transcriptional regulator